jgi:hypothetical protein
MDDEMVAWLENQLDADYRAASAASPGPWGYHPSREFRMPGGEPLEFVGRGQVDSPNFSGIAATGPAGDPQSMADASHIARHDPDHVRIDIEAKRRLIQRHPEVIPLLTAAYRDRPGYRAEWA